MYGAGRPRGLRATTAGALLVLFACAGPAAVGPAAAPAATTAEAPRPAAAGGSPGAPAQPARGTPGEPASGRQAFGEALRLEGQGDLGGAARSFEQAFGADPALAHAGVNAGLLRERLGDDVAAAEAYARVLAVHPGFGPAIRNLVRLGVRRGELGGAEADVRERLSRAPDAPALHDALAEVLLAAGRLDEAEQEARRALKLDEKNVPAMVTLATAYTLKKRHELARVVLENARQVDDRDPALWNRLGFVELALGNRPQALEHFKAAAALGPDYPEAHANYGAFLADAEDFAGAAAELEIAVRYGPRSAAAWLGLGNAYRGTQQFEKAESAYRRALELDPALSEVHFNLAVLYLDGERPGTPALERLEQAVGFFDAFEKAGGKEPKLAAYRKDAAKAIDREKKRLAREERDRLRREAEARKKEEEARKEAELAAQKAAEEQAKLAAEAEARRVEEAQKAAGGTGQGPAGVPAAAPGASDGASAPNPGPAPESKGEGGTESKGNPAGSEPGASAGSPSGDGSAGEERKDR